LIAEGIDFFMVRTFQDALIWHTSAEKTRMSAIALFSVLENTLGMRMDWVRQQLERRGASQTDLARAIGLTESQMSKAMNGGRRLTASEADSIRRFFGYRLPDDPLDPVDALINDHLTRLRTDQKRALALYLEALRGDRG
jgi:transcriptional regulator with XRE-family HTH domain